MADADFRAQLASIARVSCAECDGAPLAHRARADVRSRTRALALRVPYLDDELGVTFPCVRVIPRFVWQDMGTGAVTRGLVGAQKIGGVIVIAIDICAPTLIAFDSELVEGVLAHEFLHYVWMTIRFYQSIHRDGPNEIGPLYDKGAYFRDWESYRNIDKEMQVDAKDWLSPRLLELVGEVEAGSSIRIQQADRRIRTKWLEPGYPVQQGVPNINAAGTLVLDMDVLEKANRLGLLRL